MKKYLIIAFLFTAGTMVSGQIPDDIIKAIIKREVAAKRSRTIISFLMYASSTC